MDGVPPTLDGPSSAMDCLPPALDTQFPATDTLSPAKDGLDNTTGRLPRSPDGGSPAVVELSGSLDRLSPALAGFSTSLDSVFPATHGLPGAPDGRSPAVADLSAPPDRLTPVVAPLSVAPDGLSHAMAPPLVSPGFLCPSLDGLPASPGAPSLAPVRPTGAAHSLLAVVERPTTEPQPLRSASLRLTTASVDPSSTTEKLSADLDPDLGAGNPCRGGSEGRRDAESPWHQGEEGASRHHGRPGDRDGDGSRGRSGVRPHARAEVLDAGDAAVHRIRPW
jgi:hypothetical protein